MEHRYRADDPDEYAVGIDLGTTNSVVAYVRGGQVQIVPDEDGHHLHPSVVAFKPSGVRICGLKARLRRVIDPANTIFSAKRIIGQPFSSRSVQQAIAQFPFRVEEGANQEPVAVTRAGRIPVIEISSHVLGHLKEAAERHLGRAVSHCVITVPAHFSDGQRAATRQAAERAGFEVLRVLNEPTAAALAYGIGRDLDQRIVVFDMGGGTFDVTVLAIRGNLFEVIATGGDPYLGGDDMDMALADWLAERFLEVHRIDLREHRHAKAKTLIAAEQIKMQLSDRLEVDGSISELDYGEGGVPLDLDFHVTRAELEAMVAPLADRALLLAEAVLAEANLAPQLVDEVLLVGGATRVPLVRDRVAELFGRPPRSDVSPLMAVAAGAAVQAQMLFAPPQDDMSAALLMDVTPHGLGVATVGRYTDILIQKNTPIPTEQRRVFSTSTDNQTIVDIQVCEGENKRFDDNHALGTLRLDGLSPAPRGRTRIEVSFLLDADGILQVAARDLGTGKAQQASLRINGVGQNRAVPGA